MLQIEKLLNAADAGDLDTVLALLSAGVPVDATNVVRMRRCVMASAWPWGIFVHVFSDFPRPQNEQTALLKASNGGHLAVVSALLSAKARIELRNLVSNVKVDAIARTCASARDGPIL